MTYKIETRYLEHSGGTKFYETVLITEKDGPSILIKRFGKIADKIGAGQAQLVRGSESVTREEMVKILNAKIAGKAGQGSYSYVTRPDFALHAFNEVSVEAASLHLIVEKHYKPQQAHAIYNYFGITHDGLIDEEGDSTDDAVEPEEEPAPRDAAWGSW